MKLSKTPVARTGLFIIICFSLLIVAIFLIGDKQKLFSSTSIYYAKFKDVSGLKEGAQVQVAGINVGSVNTITLPSKAGDSVVLSLFVVKNVIHLIHADSRAKIVTEGLVGNKAIAITVGGTQSPHSPPGSYIIGENGIELGGIMDTVTQVMSSTSELLRNVNSIAKNIADGNGTLGSLLTKDDLYKNLSKTISTTNALMENISSTIGNADAALKGITESAKQSAASVAEILQKLSNGKGSIARLVNDSSLYVDLEASLRTLSASVYDVRDLIHKFSKTAGNTEEVTEALKHNFLVKGYFEDRGSWNTDDYEVRLDRKLDSLRMLEKQLKSAQ